MEFPELKTRLGEAAEELRLPAGLALWTPQTTKYKLYHLNRSCPDMRSTSPVTANRVEKSLWLTCSRCLNQTLEGDPIRNGVAIGRLNQALEVIEHTQYNQKRGVKRPATASVALREAIELTKAPARLGVTALIQVASEIRSAAEALLSQVGVSDKVRTAMVAKCAADLAFNLVRTSNTSVKLHPDPDLKVLTHNTLLSGLNKFREWLVAGNSIQAAAKAAEGMLISNLGDAPVDFYQIPEVGKLDPSDYAGPKEWAAAEWRHAAQERISEAVSYWIEQQEAAMQRLGDQMVTVALMNLQRRDESGTASVLGIFEVHTDQSKQAALAVVPMVVAKWLEAAAPNRTGKLAVKVIHCGPGVTSEQAEVALSIYEPGGDGPMAKIYQAVQAGRMTTL